MRIISLASGFPAVVNEKAARVVAAAVVVMAVAAIATGWLWLTALLALGFALRVASGPRIDPLGRFAAHVVAPRLGAPRPVAGSPKRFAQGIGLAFSGAALLALVLGASAVAFVLLATLALFAVLEAALGFCAGCRVYALLIRVGVVPDDSCVECADISLRARNAAA